MTNPQAARLRPGAQVRRKGAPDATTVYVVERIESVPHSYGAEIRVYAGGQAFMAWEVERCDPQRGWPAP